MLNFRNHFISEIEVQECNDIWHSSSTPDAAGVAVPSYARHTQRFHGSLRSVLTFGGASVKKW